MKILLTQKLRAVYRALVGRRTGIVRDITPVDTIDGDANVCHVAATIANAHPGWEADISLSVGGAGETREQALTAALCEGLERYAAASHNDFGESLMRRSELKRASFSPGAFAQFSRQQRATGGFPFVEPDDAAPLRWTSGRRITDAAPLDVPAFAVYVPYRVAPGEPLVAPGISTGLCCADSIDAAILGGVYEVIERDALALTWLQGMTPPRIDGDWLLEQAGDVLPPADRVVAFDLTSDIGVPVVLIVCRGQGPRGPLLSVGSACRLDGRAATRKAAIEAAQGRVYVRQLVEQQPDWQPLPDFSNVTDFSHHARLYSARPDLIEDAFAFLFNAAAPAQLTSMDGPNQEGVSAMGQVIQSLRIGGHDGAWVDLTPDWAAALPLHVVKVVIPSLLPLHGHHRLAYLGHKRLACALKAMPRAEVRHKHESWPYPHPFP